MQVGNMGAADAMLAKATNVAIKNTDNFILLSSDQPILEPYLWSSLA
jgi:hypothetical protein